MVFDYPASACSSTSEIRYAPRIPSTLPKAAPISRFRLTCLMRISNSDHADADRHAHRRGHRAVQIEGMKEESRAGQDGDKKNAYDEQVVHKLNLPSGAAIGCTRARSGAVTSYWQFLSGLV